MTLIDMANFPTTCSVAGAASQRQLSGLSATAELLLSYQQHSAPH